MKFYVSKGLIIIIPVLILLLAFYFGFLNNSQNRVNKPIASNGINGKIINPQNADKDNNIPSKVEVDLFKENSINKEVVKITTGDSQDYKNDIIKVDKLSLFLPDPVNRNDKLMSLGFPETKIVNDENKVFAHDNYYPTLVYSKTNGTDVAIYAYSIVSDSEKIIIDTKEVDLSPTFSPDYNKIAFIKSAANNGSVQKKLAIYDLLSQKITLPELVTNSIQTESSSVSLPLWRVDSANIDINGLEYYQYQPDFISQISEEMTMVSQNKNQLNYITSENQIDYFNRLDLTKQNTETKELFGDTQSYIAGENDDVYLISSSDKNVRENGIYSLLNGELTIIYPFETLAKGAQIIGWYGNTDKLLYLAPNTGLSNYSLNIFDISTLKNYKLVDNIEI